ncbi:MAG TPA: MATE family efflux transporter [Syntrophomonas sp.]|nr:MATE family efflux transporter [Syntrophomonas sp.]
MSQVRAELLEEKPFRLMIKLCVPAIIGMLVVGLYSFMDAVFVGQLIDENAMGAVSVTYPFTLINNGIAALVGIGSASILSRAIGKGNKASVLVLLRQLLLFIPLTLLLPKTMGIVGVWAVSPLTDGLVLILTIAFLALEYRRMNSTEKGSLT